MVGDLRTQFAAIVKRAVTAKRQSDNGERIAINSFKLFFYRYRRGKSQSEVASAVGIPIYEYKRLERVRYEKPFTGYDQKCFPLCSRSILSDFKNLP